MSVSIYVRGVKAPTDEYKKKLHAYRALEDAGLSIPDELSAYFGHNEPEEDGVSININGACEGDIMSEDGVVTIDLSKLPKGVTHVKVIASW